ncbi:MAG: glycosyltransferase, partial [Pseudomonadota bacterium]
RVLHEQNGVLGRVNALFARRVAAVACGTWPTVLPTGARGIDIGNPVRASILERHGAPYIPTGDHPMMLLVFGGSQGARVLSEVVPQAVALLPDRVRRDLRVVQQARAEDHDQVTAAYAKIDIQARVEPFLNDMSDLLAEAQVVVSRSGASSVADIAIVGRPSVLVPLGAAIRDEQTANAMPLRRAGAAVVLAERDFMPDSLAKSLSPILRDPRLATSMAGAALGLARPDATSRLVDLVERIAAGEYS